MTLELNIFYMCKKQFHPEEEEEPEKVCMIDNLVEEHCDQKMLEDLNESLGDLDEGLLEPLDLLATCETKVWLILILMITKQGLELMIIFQV